MKFCFYFYIFFGQNMWKSKISIHKLSPQPVVKNSVDLFQGIAMTFFFLKKCIFFNLDHVLQWNFWTLPFVLLVTFGNFGQPPNIVLVCTYVGWLQIECLAHPCWIWFRIFGQPPNLHWWKTCDSSEEKIEREKTCCFLIFFCIFWRMGKRLQTFSICKVERSRPLSLFFVI